MRIGDFDFVGTECIWGNRNLIRTQLSIMGRHGPDGVGKKERDALKARKQFNRAVEPQSKKVQMDCLKFNLQTFGILYYKIS